MDWLLHKRKRKFNYHTWNVHICKLSCSKNNILGKNFFYRYQKNYLEIDLLTPSGYNQRKLSLIKAQCRARFKLQFSKNCLCNSKLNWSHFTIYNTYNPSYCILDPSFLRNILFTSSQFGIRPVIFQAVLGWTTSSKYLPVKCLDMWPNY